ncbi:MAG: HAD family hydrolase [Thermoplasmata archaeon]|nr:HAD family hydrolase [Thermoplasmata archaeon]
MFAVTFDLWHTLIQLSPADEDRYIRLQESTLADIIEGSAPDPQRASSLSAVEAVHTAFASAMARRGRGAPIDGLAIEAARLAGRIPAPDRWVAASARLVDGQRFFAVPGARAQLEQLSLAGSRTAVVSNLVGESGRSMRRVLDRLDLSRFIESWALSDELPWAKPAPEIFWHALAPLTTAPSAAVHIGDLASDIQGARAAGFRASVQFVGAREYGPLYAALCRTDDPIEPPPDRVLSSWAGLPSLLEGLFGTTDASPARR